MTSKEKREFWDILSAAAAIIVLYIFFDIIGIGCPIKFVTGISCMGCGMTRAWRAVLHFDLHSAFYYHPGFWLPPIALFSLYLKYKKNIKFYKIFMFTVIGCFVTIYVARLIWFKSDIVVFQPQNNILSRVMKSINTKGENYVL